MGQLKWRGWSWWRLALIVILQNHSPRNCLASLVGLAVVGVEAVAARLIDVVWTEMVEVRVRFLLMLINEQNLDDLEEVGGEVVGVGVSAGGLWGVK